jgi:hypothetical protein
MKTAPFGLCGVLLLPCFSILAIAKPDHAPRSAHTWEAPPVLAMMFHGPGYTDPEYGWSLVPSFVLYADGRVIVAVRRSSRDGMSRAIWEGRLDSAGVCTLLDQIAADEAAQRERIDRFWRERRDVCAAENGTGTTVGTPGEIHRPLPIALCEGIERASGGGLMDQPRKSADAAGSVEDPAHRNRQQRQADANVAGGRFSACRLRSAP